jgi:hypothetical protein
VEYLGTDALFFGLSMMDSNSSHSSCRFTNVKNEDKKYKESIKNGRNQSMLGVEYAGQHNRLNIADYILWRIYALQEL